MKKNITINLFGTLYAIDEDAYEMLDSYLSSMKQYFSRRPEGSEVADDIEHRVAELLWERREAGMTAIDVDTIRQIITTIGNPAEMTGEEDASATDTSGFAQTPPVNTYAERPRRVLYRDTNNKMLGGVCAGLAQYTNSDPMLWRIIFLLVCLFVAPVIVVLYLVMLVVVPEARTAEDRLRMVGRPVTPENLNEEIMTASSTSEPEQQGRKRNWPYVLLIAICAVLLIALLLRFVSAPMSPLIHFGIDPAIPFVGNSLGLLHFGIAHGLRALIFFCAFAIALFVLIYGIVRMVRHDSKRMSTGQVLLLLFLFIFSLWVMYVIHVF